MAIKKYAFAGASQRVIDMFIVPMIESYTIKKSRIVIIDELVDLS